MNFLHLILLRVLVYIHEYLYLGGPGVFGLWEASVSIAKSIAHYFCFTIAQSLLLRIVEP